MGSDPVSVPGSGLVTAIRERDAAALEGLLAEDVVFHSPVATYEGRPDVVHLLATIGATLDGVETVRELGEPGQRVTVIAARAAGSELDGALIEVLGEDGRIRRLTLLLRPLDALLPAVRQMGRALAADPLPSGRRPG